MNQDFELDLKELVPYVFKRAWIAVIAAILAGAVFFSYSIFFITPQYTSQATLYVINRQSGNITSTELIGYESLLNDYLQIISSRAVIESVIEKSGTQMNFREFSNRLSLSHKPETRIIKVSFTHEDPSEAVRLVNLVCTETSEYITELMKSDQIKIVDYGNLPTSPSSPDAKKNFVLGAFAGFMIPVAVFVLKFILDDKITTAEDVEKRLGVNVIGRIPYSSQLNRKAGFKKK
ncbi:MAG: hypothetical protein IKV97_05325 [Clostridia bacterium]|nr:hypothetical protein [Clostridia bacterium]